MRIDINEIIISDEYDDTTLAEMKVADDTSMTLNIKEKLFSYDDIDELNLKIKEGYYMLFPEHKGKM